MRKYKGILFLLLALLVCSIQAKAQETEVSRLVFLGNKKTKESYLRNFIKYQEGSIADSLKISDDKRALRKLPSVLEVEHYLVPQDSGSMLVYQITERYTILPIGDFGVSDDYFYFGLGAMETNAFGRGIYFLGYYRFSKQHSFQTITKIPYLFGTKYGLHVQAYLWNTEETISTDDFSSKYDYNYFDFQFLVRYEVEREHIIHAGITYHTDEYQLKDTNITGNIQPHMYYEYTGLKVIHRIEHIDNRYFISDGWSNRIIAEMRFPFSSYHPSFYFHESFSYYVKNGSRGNYCSRFELGFSTQQVDPFSDFTLSDYKNIRGIGYNALRGNAVVSFNTEYRFTLFHKRYFASQAVGFADAGNVRGYQQSFSEMFDPAKFQLFTGLGFRLVFIEAHNAVLSIDYGINPNDTQLKGFVFRWGQFF